MFAFEPSVLAEHSIHGRGSDGHDILIEHQEGQSPVAFQRMFVMETKALDDLGLREPPVARDFSVVLVDTA